MSEMEEKKSELRDQMNELESVICICKLAEGLRGAVLSEAEGHCRGGNFSTSGPAKQCSFSLFVILKSFK